MKEILNPLTKSDVQEILGISERTLERWIRDGYIPAPKILGPRRAYWARAVIEMWLEKQLGTPDEELKTKRRRGRPRKHYDS